MHPEAAIETLKTTGLLADVSLDALLDLTPLKQDDEENIAIALTLRNCQLQTLVASFTTFEQPVLIENCGLEQGVFMSCYFPAGLTLRNCHLRSELDFQCGGHNEPEAAIVLEDNTFDDFVNFYDCVFEGPVVVRNNHFRAGTNLLGNLGEPFAVHFEIPPVLENNQGEMAKSGG